MRVLSRSRHQSSLQLSPVPATPYFEQLSIGAGRRTPALSLAILITGFLLLMLLFFDPGTPPEKREERVIVVRLEPAGAAEEKHSAEPDPSEAKDTARHPGPAKRAEDRRVGKEGVDRVNTV